MKTVKVLVLTLMLGLAGIAYASDGASSSTKQCKMMQSGASCCAAKDAKAANTSCCTEGSSCCASDCCKEGASCCATDGSGCKADAGCCAGHSCCSTKASTE